MANATRALLPAAELELESVPCDLCGASDTRERYSKPDTRYWTSEHVFPVVQCRRCGLVYVNPRPTAACMARFYPSGYHERRDDARSRARYARQLELLELREDALLDIGCANGDFLAHALAARPGLRAVGVDAYSPGVRDARIEFHPRPLPECGLAAGSFPLVTAWAVFEHLHEPARYFREVERLLAPGGRFVFLVTNAESFFSRRAYREDVPRHTYHFSEPVLARYAGRTGLRMTRCRYDDRIFDGRGKGTLRWLFARAAGASWPAVRRGLNPLQRTAAGAGRLLDGLVFGPHWEARLRRSGILVVEFRKSAPRA